MTAISKSRLRIAIAVGLAVAGIVGQKAGANPPANEPPKVEFTEVEGCQCLQPVVHGAGAQLADYRAAEARWLAIKYPGILILEAKTEFILPLAIDVGRQPERTTVQRETLYLDGIVGAGAVICFDINLETISGE